MDKVADLLSNEFQWLTGGTNVNSGLHQASNAAVVEKILLETEDHNALDSNGDAPLHCYVKRRDREKYNCLIMFLIHSKCDVNLRNGGGQTALHLACKDNNVDVAKALITFDAKINTINTDNQTPLDLVPRGSELEELLALLGAMRYQEIQNCRRGDYSLDTFLDDGFSTPPESAEELKSFQYQEEQMSKDKEDDLKAEKETRTVQDDLSSIAVSLMIAGGLATREPLERQGETSGESALSSSRQHAHSSVQSNKKHKPRKDIGAMRRNIFTRKNSEAALKFQSDHNPDMEVMDSVIGHSVVKALAAQQQESQKVLCLDGGGMKGLIQIEMLKMIEQMTGKSIMELFDWIVGTSTGAILALGMVYGERSLESLRSTYFGMKDNVFKPQFKAISQISDTNALEETIKGMFGTERRMCDVKKPKVLVTAVDKSTTALPLVFFNNCFEDKFSNELVWKVARYTTAAPVYFSECDNYVDGGVKANDPAAFGLTEIQRFLSCNFGSAPKISCVVSLGCGVYPSASLGNTDIASALKKHKASVIASRIKELLTLLVSTIGASDDISKHCQALCEHQGIAYFRFNPQMTEAIELSERDSRKLCDIVIKAKQLFRENAEQVEKMIQHLGCKVKEDYLYHI